LHSQGRPQGSIYRIPFVRLEPYVPLPGGGSGDSTGIGSAGPSGMTDVAIVGGSEETRLLLRGLARLHHHRVVFEGPAPTALADLPKGPDGLTVLIDADIEAEEWADPIEQALRPHPGRRGILIAPSRSPRVELRAKELGFAAVLRRPFAVHELVSVLTPASEGSSTPPPEAATGSDDRPP